MYCTRPLSLYKRAPEELSLPPEGPNSGYLVLQDENSTSNCNLGTCKDIYIKDLPLPQNKRLFIECLHEDFGDLPREYYVYNEVCLIPIINHPLSSNRYYAIKAEKRHKGKSYSSSKEQEKGTCCFCCLYIKDVKPRCFDAEDIYQQFEFTVMNSSLNPNMLLAKSVAPDGHPPSFLRAQGWKMTTASPDNFTLGEARGLNSSLRAHLPDLSFPSSNECSECIVVGKWYCPFMFIKEGKEKDQMKRSMFYEMTLEQRWKRIFSAQRSYYCQEKTVKVDVVIPTETVSVAGKKAIKEEESSHNERGVVWFKGINLRKSERKVGLSSLIIERMMWEEERFGWVKTKEKQVRLVKDAEYEGIGDWTRFHCYVLLETFVLKRNDGSIVLTYDFNHTHHVRSKWE
ncbi:CTP synthase [Bienertia sinuspersici]